MMINRRLLLATVPSLLAWSARTDDAPTALANYERETGGRVGLYAVNTNDGAVIAWRADERFIMCSTFKASLAAFVLARIDRGDDRLDASVAFGPADLLEYAPVARQHLASGAMSVATMAEAAVTLSDNTCANLLLARVGGPEALTAFWRETGDTISRLDHNEPLLNRAPPGDPHDTTTPASMVGTLRRLVLGNVLSPASRERLANWMVGCTTGGNRLRAGLPKNWRVGDKTGNNGADACGDIAVVWPRPDASIVICAYTQGGRPTAAEWETLFAQIGGLVTERLG